MFSELVDRCIKIAGRPDQLTAMAQSANETIRAISKRGNWPDDTVEELVQPPPDPRDRFIWTPEVGRGRFRREDYIEDMTGAEPTAVRPSRRVRDLRFYYYRSGESFVISGATGAVMVYYYAYQPWLPYFPVNNRPSTFNVMTGEWTNDDPEVLARVTNWMLERHNSVVEAGTLARFFAGKADQRQALHYTIFEQGITHIQQSEGIEELLGRRRG